jgi:pimeloyl-ACP methyl ester carboxylesterase
VTLQTCYSPGRDPALVFLHGGLGNRFNWRCQYEFALAQGWAVLAYDLAGHGQSSSYRNYSIGRHCRDLSRLLQQVGIQSPILCCHSYGVPLGLEWVQRNPAKALILVAGGTHELDPWWEIPLTRFMGVLGRHLFRLQLTQQINRWLSSRVRNASIEQFFRESPIPTDFEPYRSLEIFWGYNFFTRRKHDRHRQIPTLILTGGQDPMFSAQMGEELASHFQICKHLHYPQAGHLLMAEYPDQVNLAIRTWLTEIGVISSLSAMSLWPQS